MKLGKLEEIDVRELWKHEQYDFSEWLSKDGNYTEIGNILGLTLTNITTEVYVGAYRCDLAAEDETTGIRIIIENQLEHSDHDHLGKIITYASGLDARAIVWVVTEAREEHRSAIEWLNKHTDGDIGFFLLEIHAYRIGDSLPAPKFVPIEIPNEFNKSSKSQPADAELKKTEAERLEFWTQFNDVLAERGTPFNKRKATTDHWYDVALGTSKAHLEIDLVNKAKEVVIAVNINDDKELYDQVSEHASEIEEKLRFSLEWDRMDYKKASRIKYHIPGLDFDNHDNYPELMNKIIDTVLAMRKVFKEYLERKQPHGSLGVDFQDGSEDRSRR